MPPPTLSACRYDVDPAYFEPCYPDYLRNHDSGSLLADMEFIEETLSAGGIGYFVPDFNGSTTTRYCVSRPT